MKGIRLINKGKVVIPIPQTEEYRSIIRRRLIQLEQKYEIIDVEFYPVVLTPQEQVQYDKKYTPTFKYYAVLTKAQLGNYLGLEGEDLDNAWNRCRQNLAGTRCLFGTRFTDDAYTALGSTQQSFLYPVDDREDFQTVNVTIYEYLDANRAKWEKGISE